MCMYVCVCVCVCVCVGVYVRPCIHVCTICVLLLLSNFQRQQHVYNVDKSVANQEIDVNLSLA